MMTLNLGIIIGIFASISIHYTSQTAYVHTLQAFYVNIL